MTRIKMLGSIVFAVFTVFAVAASTASALEWLDNGHSIVQAAGILVLLTGTLNLGDLGATGGATEITCEGNGHATVGPGDRGTIKTIKATSCKFVSGKNGSCEASKEPKATGVHLPWTTLLLTVAGQTTNMIEGTGGGAGYNVECTVAGIFKVQDTCETNGGNPDIINNTTAGDVTARFLPSETAKCSLNGGATGMVVGDSLIFSDVLGLKISVSP